jgi:hypothetical protein
MRIKNIKLVLTCFVLICFFLPHVMAQQYMQIKKKDGSVTQILLSDICKLTFSDFATTLPEQKAKVMQAIVKLKSYPNPASTYIIIDYELTLPGIVMLEIYSITGMLIYSASLDNQGIGKYSYRWNTDNIKSGIYIFKIRQNNKIVNEKVIVSK